MTCEEDGGTDPGVHVARTSDDIHAFLAPRAKTPPKDMSPAPSTCGGSDISACDTVNGKEDYVLVDYGAHIWRELAQAMAERPVDGSNGLKENRVTSGSKS